MICRDCKKPFELDVDDDPDDDLCFDCTWQRHLASQPQLGTNTKLYIGNDDKPERFFEITSDDLKKK